MALTIKKQSFEPELPVTIRLPLSKSICNRLLVMYAINKKPFDALVVSDSNDTILLRTCLTHNAEIYDLEDAGTPYRFLLALFAVSGKKCILTGHESLQKRPIAPLVDALRGMGATIEYLNEEGHPPVAIKKGVNTAIKETTIFAGESSQYISAMMLCAPLFQDGLTIKMTGSAVSSPYMHMTADLMKQAGISLKIKENTIKIGKGNYQLKDSFAAERDWSAASYFLAFNVLLPTYTFFFPDLKLSGLQGDQRLLNLLEDFGLFYAETNKGIHTGMSPQNIHTTKQYNLSDMPDIAPTLICLHAVMQSDAVFTGIEHLAIKESNRLLALQTELNKTGIELHKTNDSWFLHTKNYQNASFSFHSWNDHRIAMALSLFACKTTVTIDRETVVKKSFPDYWQQLSTLKFEIK